MVTQLTGDECKRLKCDMCNKPLCKKVNGGYEIQGHYFMGDTFRCVECYKINDKI